MFTRFSAFIAVAKFVIAATLAGSQHASASPPASPFAGSWSGPISQIIVFGDSISDTGNFHLATGGVVAGPPYFEGRFSNGPVWIEVLAEQLSLPAPGPSIIGGSNYAWGGAQTGGGLSFFGTPNVGVQIASFLSDGDLCGDELIVVAAGSNDLAWQPPYSPALIVKKLSQHVRVLAAAGGQTFLVPNLVALGQTPGNRGTPNEVALDVLSAQVNNLMNMKLPLLEQELAITILRFDMRSVVDAMADAPGEFGLTDVSEPACPGCGIGLPDPEAADTIVANPDEHLWWDYAHFTRVTHATIGEAVADVVAATAAVEP